MVVITSYHRPASWQRDQNLLKAGRGVRGVAGVPVRKSGIGKFNPDDKSRTHPGKSKEEEFADRGLKQKVQDDLNYKILQCFVGKD